MATPTVAALSRSPARVLLSRLHGVKRTADSRWLAHCPVQSRHILRIEETPDSRVLLRCLAGCPVDSVLNALDLELDDLFPGALAACLEPVVAHSIMEGRCHG